jgi:hypothetical protein
MVSEEGVQDEAAAKAWLVSTGAPAAFKSQPGLSADWSPYGGFPTSADALSAAFCPVTLADDSVLAVGSAAQAVGYAGQVYLCATAEAKAKFLANPGPYANAAPTLPKNKLRIAVVGPPCSGGHSIAAKLAATYGVPTVDYAASAGGPYDSLGDMATVFIEPKPTTVSEVAECELQLELQPRAVEEADTAEEEAESAKAARVAEEEVEAAADESARIEQAAEAQALAKVHTPPLPCTTTVICAVARRVL